ncbi:MAG: exodeoxyribonuclease VII small subunit [Mailhella sp.]|nr:exodeoxyribonuclease VII small subunit [Mailhella sp.]
MPKKDAKLSFEDGLARIKEITALLENKDCTLEQSIRLYREGMEISEQCRRELEAARHEMEILNGDQPAPFAPAQAVLEDVPF